MNIEKLLVHAHMTPEEELQVLASMRWTSGVLGPHLQVWLVEEGSVCPTPHQLVLPESDPEGEFNRLFSLTHLSSHQCSDGGVVLVMFHPALQVSPLRHLLGALQDDLFGIHSRWDREVFQRVMGRSLSTLGEVQGQSVNPD